MSIRENIFLSEFSAGIFITTPTPTTIPDSSSIDLLIAFMVFPVA